MTSKRKKVKSSRKERDENRKHKHSRSHSHQENVEKGEPRRKRHHKQEKYEVFQPARLNASVITARRLSVGVKGIFGNSRNSSSVYREIKERIENKKLSEKVSSEIELSLSRIIPSRCKTSKYGTFSASSASSSTKDRSIDVHTPACSKDGSYSVLRSIENSVKSGSSNKITPKGTQTFTPLPTPLHIKQQGKKPYKQIARSLKSGLSKSSLFKHGQIIKDIKDELQFIYNERSSLTVKPLFTREDYETASREEDLKEAQKAQVTFDAGGVMEISPVYKKKGSTDQSVPSISTHGELPVAKNMCPSKNCQKSEERSFHIERSCPDLLFGNFQPTNVHIDDFNFMKGIKKTTNPEPICNVQPPVTTHRSNQLTCFDGFTSPMIREMKSFQEMNAESLVCPQSTEIFSTYNLPTVHNEALPSMFMQPYFQPVKHIQLQPDHQPIYHMQPPIPRDYQLSGFLDPSSKSIYLKPTLSHSLNTFDLQKHAEPSGSTSQGDESITLMSMQRVLDQPVNKMRCSRSDPKARSIAGTGSQSMYDLLDGISVSPELFKNDSQTDNSSSLYFGLEKPVYESPSPPPYYRMSMF